MTFAALAEDERLEVELFPERREQVLARGGGSRAAAAVVQGVIADLDRKWAVPPVEFCRELARETVRAFTHEPTLLDPLADLLAERIARRLAAREDCRGEVERRTAGDGPDRARAGEVVGVGTGPCAGVPGGPAPPGRLAGEADQGGGETRPRAELQAPWLRGGGWKALTVQQPYAHLIALPPEDDDAKRVENRGWSVDWTGTLAVHAGRGRDYLEPGDEERFPGMAFGAFVAVCRLAGCVRLEEGGRVPDWADRRWPWLKCHRHVEGPYCWVLTELIPLARPLPCRGYQGLWAVPPGLQEQILACL